MQGNIPAFQVQLTKSSSQCLLYQNEQLQKSFFYRVIRLNGLEAFSIFLRDAYIDIRYKTFLENALKTKMVTIALWRPDGDNSHLSRNSIIKYANETF